MTNQFEADETTANIERDEFNSVHGPLLRRLPKSGAAVLDIGAGTGRDAAWFSSNGYDVTAVEPSTQLLDEARSRHPDPRIRWFNDQLPDLKKVLASRLTFDLIWISAVWHYLPKSVQSRAMRKLVTMLSPGGQMMISIWKNHPNRSFVAHDVTPEEVEQLAHNRGFVCERFASNVDKPDLADANWEAVWLQLPDDGTNALPLIRHVVSNDSKSSTYKLALLRVLVRIAVSASGFARENQGSNSIEVPLGLVALYWLRTFTPLIKQKFRQVPGSSNRMGFVNEPFRQLLHSQSPIDLRIGQRFTGSNAANVVGAINDAANLIQKMPVSHITFPGSADAVFRITKQRKMKSNKDIYIDSDFLWSFGSFSIPVELWHSMGRYSPWIEPAILTEWIDLTRKYYKQEKGETAPPMGDVWAALQWADSRHDTSVVRRRLDDLSLKGNPIYCVWTGKKLKDPGVVAIDHCFPFAAWPCNDLWNLLPSDPRENSKKSDRLPSVELLDNARDRLMDWWDVAYWSSGELERQFKEEARSALPTVGHAMFDVTTDSVFEAVMVQQRVLKRDQQLPEWMP